MRASTQVDAPLVSVVVISYNDAARLPRAIRSVQRQTLRALEIIVVDDASTDDTETVVAELAAADPRIRYVRLNANSGGCSAPRNTGLEMAAAPWVMFCDSDDEYELHACTNLLEAVERTGADIACGTAERVDAATGRAKRWRPELHDGAQVADGLGDLPGLLYDTISVNKIYRRSLLLDHGIRFPEGLLFEDQLFTLEAMAAARRIAVIPETVYRWYVDRLTDEPSITQRRNEARNVESRIEVNRRIDDFLARHPDPRLRREKDRKFLRHDLYLYLSSMLEVDDETATLLMDRLMPYVSVVDVSPAWELRPGLRIAIYHLLQRDLEGVRAAMCLVRWASVVDRPVVPVDGRELWDCSHRVDGPPARGIDADRWLDVTDLGLLATPFTQRRYLHRVESLEVDGERVILAGSSVDYDGSLAGADAVAVRWDTGSGRTTALLAGTWTGYDGCRRRWRAEGRLSSGERPVAADDRGSVVLAVGAGRLVNVTAVRLDGPVELPTGLPGPGVTVLRLAPGANGSLGWSTRSGGTAPPPPIGRAARAWRGLRIRAARALARLLPASPAVVVDGGRQPDPDVLQVAAMLRAAHPDVDQVWVRRGSGLGLPAGVRTVERGSARHAWVQARATGRLEGNGAEPAAGLRRSAVVMAVSATPVHRVGLDDPEVLTSRSQAAAIRRRGRTLGLLAVPTAAAGEVLAAALAVRGRAVPVGLPRMDDALAEANRPALRDALDLPSDRPVVLWTPLLRPGAVLDLEVWEQALGAEAYLVVAAGTPPVPTRLRHAVRGLSATEDMAAFLAAVDLVVSDYSPLIGDAVVADRPVVLYQPDRTLFLARTCGVYPGLSEVGPVVIHQEDLHDEVGRWLGDPAGWDVQWGESRQAWGERWAGPADGRAGERAAAALVAAMRGER
jgi:CDP-glycerol glycerophosphotransferase